MGTTYELETVTEKPLHSLITFNLYSSGMMLLFTVTYYRFPNFTFQSSDVDIDSGVVITVDSGITFNVILVPIFEHVLIPWQGIVASDATTTFISMNSRFEEALMVVDASNNTKLEITKTLSIKMI